MRGKFNRDMTSLVIIFGVLLSQEITSVFSTAYDHSIQKRSLLFPRATVLQFTYGISSPLILPSRSIVFSLCLQANYDLPYNATLLQPKVIKARTERSNDLDMSRGELYKFLVNYLETFGINGQECILRLICEIAEYPLHTEEGENLLEKILHYVFTPSLDEAAPAIDMNSTRAQMVTFQDEMVFAEHAGRIKGNCMEEYENCELPLVDLFTQKYMI